MHVYIHACIYPPPFLMILYKDNTADFHVLIFAKHLY